MKTATKIISVLMVLCMICTCFAGCQDPVTPTDPSTPAGSQPTNPPEQKVEVESVKINLASVTLDIGATEQLSVKVEPSNAPQNVTYASSDAAIATVDANGLITGVAVGTAKITVTAGGKTAECEVTVEDPYYEPEVAEVNGFKPFAWGGLLGTEGGDYYPVTVTPVGDHAVSFYGKGGFSWPDTRNMKKPSAMGGYYNSELDLDGLTVTWRMDKAMDFNGDHWYVIALEDQCQFFNSWDGSDPTKTLFFMIGFDGKTAWLLPHYRDVIDLGEGWSYLGRSGGVPYEHGDTLTIKFVKEAEGLTVYLNGQLQTFDVINSPYIKVVSDLFPNDKVWVMAGAHIGNPENQYTGEYGYTLGIVTDQPNPVNGFQVFAPGGLVGETTYDTNITVEDCGTTDRVKVTGCGGTNYGDNNTIRSTMGVYSINPYKINGLELLYSVESWIDGGTDHWYAFGLSKNQAEWFENDGSDNALFFMFQYAGGNVVLLPHHIGNGAGWSYLGTSQGVPAAGGQYSILIQKVEGGYSIYMKNAEQTEYTLQSFGGTTVIPAEIVDGLFPSGQAYVIAGGYAKTFKNPWAFVIGAREAAE